MTHQTSDNFDFVTAQVTQDIKDFSNPKTIKLLPWTGLLRESGQPSDYSPRESISMTPLYRATMRTRTAIMTCHT